MNRGSDRTEKANLRRNQMPIGEVKNQRCRKLETRSVFLFLLQVLVQTPKLFNFMFYYKALKQWYMFDYRGYVRIIYLCSCGVYSTSTFPKPVLFNDFTFKMWSCCFICKHIFSNSMSTENSNINRKHVSLMINLAQQVKLNSQIHELSELIKEKKKCRPKIQQT